MDLKSNDTFADEVIQIEKNYGDDCTQYRLQMSINIMVTSSTYNMIQSINESYDGIQYRVQGNTLTSETFLEMPENCIEVDQIANTLLVMLSGLKLIKISSAALADEG